MQCALFIIHQANTASMDTSDLTQTDKAILDVLKRGRDEAGPWGLATKGYLIDETGFSRNTIYNRLEILSAHGHVEVVHEPTRLFKFVSDPREE